MPNPLHWLSLHFAPRAVLCCVTPRPSEDVAEDDAAAAADDDDAADGATTATSAASLLPSGPWRLVGVDCEMCVTKESEKELLQVALVDEDEQLLLQVRWGVGSCAVHPCFCYATSLGWPTHS